MKEAPMRSCLLLLGAISACAEVRTLTLRAAVDLALKQNPEVLIAKLEEQRAVLQVRAARDPFVPKLVAGSGLAYSNGFPMSIEGSAPSIVQVRASASVYNKQQSLQADAARQNAKTVGIDYETRKADAVFRTIELFLDADRRNRLAGMIVRQVEAARKMEQIVRSRVEEGRELPNEAKRAALEAAKAEHRALEARLDRDQSESSLAIVLGLPAGDQARPLEEERAAPAVPDSAASATESALRESREISRIESALAAKSLEIQSVRAGRLPKLELVAQYAIFAKFNNFEDFFRRFQRHNGQLGVSVQVPVFAGPAIDAMAAQAESDAAKLRIELTHARGRITAEAQRRFLDVQRAESARRLARQSLDVARGDLDIALARFDEGRATVKQVEEARMSENQRWIEYYGAQTSLERARWALLDQTGGLLAALQ
jgi:outer membrane protein TolC